MSRHRRKRAARVRKAKGCTRCRNRLAMVQHGPGVVVPFCCRCGVAVGAPRPGDPCDIDGRPIYFRYGEVKPMDVLEGVARGIIAYASRPDRTYDVPPDVLERMNRHVADLPPQVLWKIA